jgi:hypothetical protein
MMPHVLGTGIRCPKCQGDEHSVRDSRPSGDMIRRRRLCASCGHRFSTFEGFAYDDAHPLLAFRAMQLRAKVDALTEGDRDLVEKMIAALTPKIPV